MTRSVRAGLGAVVVLVLLLVAAVSGLVTGVVGAQLRDGGWAVLEAPPSDGWFVDPVTAPAEVLDVDGGPADGWLSVDVAVDTADGREVVAVDLGEQGPGGPPPPQVGDTIEVVHERDDPGFALRADDPALTGTGDDPADPGGPTPEEALDAARGLAERTRVLALAALALAVLVGVLTVVAVRRAPPPTAVGRAPGPPPPGPRAAGR